MVLVTICYMTGTMGNAPGYKPDVIAVVMNNGIGG